jgi:hypothetical protein
MDAALGSVDAIRTVLEQGGWVNVQFALFERPWPAREYLDWLAMPVVAEGLCGPDDKDRADELIAHVRGQIDPEAPLMAAWYLVTADKPEE